MSDFDNDSSVSVLAIPLINSLGLTVKMEKCFGMLGTGAETVVGLPAVPSLDLITQVWRSHWYVRTV